ncbi:MAG: DUF5000 domain-containing lipoprotein [Mangrovibacterium sp.]
MKVLSLFYTNVYKRHIFGIAAAMVLLLYQCVAPEEWHDPADNIPPGPVSNVRVENINGGALIIYTLPNDNDVLGAKVVYNLTTGGELMEKYASNDTIMLEGYGDTNEYTATVYAVDKSGNVSSGILVKINPLMTPIVVMRQSLRINATFGGVQMTWDNALKKDMAVSLYMPDSTDNMVLYDTYFSRDEKGKVIFRGLESEETRFRIELRDRWNNSALPLDTTITPLFEMLLPGRQSGNDIWRQYGLDDGTFLDRGDIRNHVGFSGTVNRIFRLVHNGKRVNEGGQTYWHPGDHYAMGDFIPDASGPLVFPIYFTVDMGRKAVYSRFNFLPRNRNPVYSADLPCDFEIWGSNDPKPLTPGDRMANLAYWTEWSEANGTDAWKNDWTKIATCKVILSSGESKYRDGIVLSAEDIDNYTNNGYNFDMDNTWDAFRYLRFVIYDTNTSAKSMTIDEITFWGMYSD